MDPELIRGRGFESLALSHPGCRRENNEDNALQDAELRLWAVADGMGGHDRGEVASRIAVETVRDRVSGGEPIGVAVKQANDEICQQSAKRATNMGTTFVGMQQSDVAGPLNIAWVGDSRIYRLRGGTLECLSTDHTLVNELVAGGVLTEEAAKEHPDRHRLTRALGGGQCQFDLDVDTLTVQPETDDIYLLCSDGLCGVLEDAQTAATMRSHGTDLEPMSRALLQQVLDAGAPDNVTMVLMRWLGQGDG